MDPSIVKLLEEDEDESMHSGADVEAFQAALNRDIEGDVSTSQPSDMNTVVNSTSQQSDTSTGSNHTSSQSFAQWQTACRDENTGSQSPNSSRNIQLHQQEQTRLHSQNQQQQNDSQEPNYIPLQRNQSHDSYQQGPEIQISPQVPQAIGMHISEKNSILMREPERMHNQDNESQYLKLQKMSNQQASNIEQSNNSLNRNNKQIPFAVLLPTLLPQLDKDRAMQLHTLYAKLQKNEIAKDGFIRHMRGIVGDQMLKLAINKLRLQMSSSQFQIQSQASARQNHPRMTASAAATQFTDPQSSLQVHKKTSNSPIDLSLTPTSTVEMKTESGYPTIESNVKKPWEVERSSNQHAVLVGPMSSSNISNVIQEREHSSTPVQGLSKQLQQHMPFQHASFPRYGTGSVSGSYNPFSGTSVDTSSSSLKTQPQDSQMRQTAHNQSVGSSPFGGAGQPVNTMSLPKFESQEPMNDPSRVQGGSLSHISNNSALQHNSVHWQASTSKEQSSGHLSSMTYIKLESFDQGADQQQTTHLCTPQGLPAAKIEQGNATPRSLKDDLSENQPSRMVFSTSTSMMLSSSSSPSMTTQLDSSITLSSRFPSTTSPAGIKARAPAKKPSIGQKKPLDALGSSPPASSKKQKASGPFSDQSIEQLNDVTAVSGVNLREEEEQLFSVPKEDSRITEASRRVVQEEEERLLLQKSPLQKKLAEILVNCGLKNISNDVERCLSLCVEERMRGLISNIIRMSKQRVDAEKGRHRTFITSDVQQQIMMINQKAKDEWERKQAEAEKLQRLNQAEVDSVVDVDKEKDDGRVKLAKANKEEDDKMRTTAANVAARAAVGGDDMFSKWQLMAEQARQKREGGIDTVSGSRAGKDVSQKPLLVAGINAEDNQETEESGRITSISASGNLRKLSKNQPGAPQTGLARTVSVKDVIAVLEREPQMCKSAMVYRLYDKIYSEASAE